MITLLSPPTAIPATPKSKPLIHSPLPNPNTNGFPEVFLSNTLPFFNLPMYLIPTLLPDLAVVPFPTFSSSVMTPPNKVFVGNFLSSVAFAASLSASFLALASSFLALAFSFFSFFLSTKVEPVGPCSNSLVN
ncbi:uncharacterized protein RJT20DRAFT_127962 [Scheffersomyces xylosifermentans]|uniref:uncharacterized protein n=1 Tax=Scheffersomyces xylosifermentans TaxID=1304137 RepID=UPI00315D2BCE